MKLLSKLHDYSVPVEFNLDQLEEELVAAVSHFLESCLAAWVEEVEACWLSSDAGKGYWSKGWAVKSVSTVLGELQIRRRRFRHSETGKVVIPVDKYLGRARASRRLKEVSVRLASEVSFAKASKFLELTLRVQRSPKRVWKDLQEAGSRLETNLAANTAHMHQTGEVIEAQAVSHDVVAVEADGTFVKGRARGEVHEVKLAIGYTSKSKRGRNRWVLENKRVWGGVTDSVTMAGRLEFLLEKEYSFSTAGRVIGRSDGGRWIANVFDNLPGGLVHQLDLHHLLTKRRECIKDPKALYECQQLAYQGNGHALLTRLRRRAAKLHDKNQTLDTLRAAHYVRENIHRIDSLAAYRQAATSEAEEKMYCRGSGAIERNISSNICDRMKHRRMHWSKRGAHHMALIRTAIANNPEKRIFH